MWRGGRAAAAPPRAPGPGGGGAGAPGREARPPAPPGARRGGGAPPPPPVARPAPPTALAARLGRRFVLTVEVLPPRGTQEGPELEACQLLRQAGADTINAPDNPMARLRMSPWAMGLRIQTGGRR